MKLFRFGFLYFSFIFFLISQFQFLIYYLFLNNYKRKMIINFKEKKQILTWIQVKFSSSINNFVLLLLLFFYQETL